jgi:putative hemolysin
VHHSIFPVARFSREFHSDVLPVYIRGRFRRIFYLYPIRLRRFLIVRNLLHPFLKRIDLVAGDRLPYEVLMKEPDLAVVSSKLREITYSLANE